MMQNRSEVSEFCSVNWEPCSSAEDMAADLAEALTWIGGPIRHRENVKGWLRRVAHAAGLSYSQAKTIRYGEWTALAEHAVIADRLRVLARKQQESAARSATLRSENEALRRLLAARSSDSADLDRRRAAVVGGWDADARADAAAAPQAVNYGRRKTDLPPMWSAPVTSNALR
jgi:hypothetical protein